MRLKIKPDLKSVFIHDFNLCFFLSLIILAVYQDFTGQYIISDHTHYFKYILLPVINGLLTIIPALLLNTFFRNRRYTKRYYTKNRRDLTLVAFLAGFLSIYITVSNTYTYIISLFIIFLAYKNIMDFSRLLIKLLEPRKMATPKDIGEFANFFINLVITFAVINLSINSIHYNFELNPAFNFQKGGASIIDAIYFSIITMTTVGYGDLIPYNVIGRAVVGLECLTSYLMLGIMISIVTRGIKLNKE